MSGYGKKGYIKTIEAIIAIVLILVFIYFVIPKELPSMGANYRVENYKKFFIKEMQYNEELREKLMLIGDVSTCESDCLIAGTCGVCQEVMQDIDDIMDKGVLGYDYYFKICDIPTCTMSALIPEERSVYMFDVLISSEGSEVNPLIVRIWMWNK